MRLWSCISLLALITPAELFAQDVPSLAPLSVDENGVDLVNGTPSLASVDVSIGGDHTGLKFVRTGADPNSSNYLGISLSDDGYNTWTVSKPDGAKKFRQIPQAGGSYFADADGSGEYLEIPAGGSPVYTARDGTAYTFGISDSLTRLMRPTSAVFPDGSSETYTWKTIGTCNQDGDICGSVSRLQSVSNSYGYMLLFEYSSDTEPTQFNQNNEWISLKKATAINLSVEYCPLEASHCSLTRAWPSSSYTRQYDSTGNITVSVTRGEEGAFQYRVFDRKSPSSVDFDYKFTQIPGSAGAGTYEFNITKNGSVWNYRWNSTYIGPVGAQSNVSDLTRTGPDGRVLHAEVTTYPPATNMVFSPRLTKSLAEIGKQISYAYDNKSRLIKAQFPDGNSINYDYDDRGNILGTRYDAKPGSGAQSTSTSALFPAACENRITCNKPYVTVDAKGARTDYAYDPVHGGVLSITAPPPTDGKPRPQTRYSYTVLQSFYKQGGLPVASGRPTYKLNQVSSCLDSSSCSGTSTEIRSITDYGVQDYGTGNNLLPIRDIRAAGDMSMSAVTTFGYDDIGNITTVDGPLAGAADTTNYTYDISRRVTSVVGPDPDAGGPLKRQAIVYHYRSDGLRDSVSRGTAEFDGKSFQPTDKTSASYDGHRRIVRQVASAGGNDFSVIGYSYNDLGQLECTAVRMDPSQWQGQTDACSPQTSGPNGPDRIQQRGYDAAGRVTTVLNAVGTTAATTETFSYSLNGQTATLTDGKGNVTASAYDGFDRLQTTTYPGGQL